MSTFLFIDSGLRDREQFKNPAEFTIKKEQISGWFRAARTVRAHPANAPAKPLEFATSIHIKKMITPYTDDLANLPVIFVDLHSQSYNDSYLISTLEGTNRDARFTLELHKIQNDSAGDPLWIHWKPVIDEQVTRFKRDEPVFFRVFTRNGTTLPLTDAEPPQPADPFSQVIAEFEITPYIRDDDYQENLVDTST